MPDKVLFVRLPRETKEEIETEAERLGLSANSFALLALSQYLERLRAKRRVSSKDDGKER